MNKNIESPDVRSGHARPEDEALRPAPADRKEFVEPEISTPVDVLEATTFFAPTTSGALP